MTKMTLKFQWYIWEDKKSVFLPWFLVLISCWVHIDCFYINQLCFKLFLVSYNMCFLTMSVKDMHSKTLSLILLFHILLRELILSVRHHVAFFRLMYQLFIYLFFFFILFSPYFFYLPFPFPFSLLFSFVFSLFCKLGVLVRHRISLFGKETLEKTLAWLSLGFLCHFCTVVCDDILHECTFAWLHVCLSQVKQGFQDCSSTTFSTVKLEAVPFVQSSKIYIVNRSYIIKKRNW